MRYTGTKTNKMTGFPFKVTRWEFKDSTNLLNKKKILYTLASHQSFAQQEPIVYVDTGYFLTVYRKCGFNEAVVFSKLLPQLVHGWQYVFDNPTKVSQEKMKTAEKRKALTEKTVSKLQELLNELKGIAKHPKKSHWKKCKKLKSRIDFPTMEFISKLVELFISNGYQATIAPCEAIFGARITSCGIFRL
jgi:hypothetical protein